MEKNTFTSDKSGNRIANIPYADYISEAAVPKNAVIPADFSEQNSGEQNGASIQKAIDSLGKNGGTISFPKGKFKINTIVLKSNITLFIPHSTELVSLDCNENESSSAPLSKAVIYAENACNIKITGSGIINGCGQTYTNSPKETGPFYALENFNTYKRVIEARKRIRMSKNTTRNNIIKLVSCNNVEISNIILKDSAEWTCVIENCNTVDINNIVIDNHIHIANSDGIDIAGTNNCNIEHCFIATGDDGIVLKSNKYAINNVTVKNCIVTSCANCFKIGTETQMDVKNVFVSDCYFFMPDSMTYGYSGIAIESCDGSNVSNVNIDNIQMDGISAPFLIWLGNRLMYDKKEIGSITNTALKNITAKNIEMPSAITGCIGDDGKSHYIRNVTLEGINVIYRESGENLNILENIGEYTMSGYPDITRVSHIYINSHEESKYWDLPCYSLCIKHAENVIFTTYKTIPRSCNNRPELYIDDLK